MINISKLTKIYGGKKALNNISFQAVKGEVISLLGPSGSGKSTVLRCIAGLENYEEGQIDININYKHEISMVFQNFNLFMNMNVMHNLCYAMRKVLKYSEAKSKDIAISMLERVGLKEFADYYPHNLSGGQKQRIAIARALCMQPKVVLFDEPTSALDPENVKEVINVIKSLLHTQITVLMVTHEMAFAAAAADKIVFLEYGSIVEENNAKDFFSNPYTDRAKDFLDKLNLS